MSNGTDKRGNHVWDYFTKSGETAECSLCNNILKISQRSITGLKYHLKSKHSIDIAGARTSVLQSEPSTSGVDPLSTVDYQSDLEEPKNKISKRNSQSNSFSREQSIDLMISRMVAKDGLSFYCLSTSEDLRYLFLKKGFSLPTSPDIIKSIVENFSSTVKDEIIKKLQHFKIQGKKFSLTVDERMFVQNKKYFNVNVHYLGTYFNLGLFHIRESYSSQHCIELIKTRLEAFLLNFNTDIVGITTDSLSLKKKVGKSLNCYEQLCFAQGIRLAVTDVLYQNVFSEETVSQNEEATGHSSDEEDCDEASEQQIFTHVRYEKPPIDLILNYKDLIDKVRNVVKIFKKSTKAACLEQHIQLDFGKLDYSLVLDCKRKWSSLFDMLERFNVLKDCITKALNDIGSDFTFSDEEWANVEELLLCLQPVKLAVEVLCRRNSTLLTADTTLRFILEKLDRQQSSISAELAIALRLMVKERRTRLSGIFLYLHNPKKYENLLKNPDDTFAVPKRNYIRIEIMKICERMFALKENMDDEPKTPESMEVLEITIKKEEGNLSLDEELEMELIKEKSDTCTVHAPSNSPDFEKIIKAEMAKYETKGIRGKYLSLVHRYINTITPTSVDAESAFSVANYTSSPLNCKLADNTIDMISFLRAYFQNNNM